MGASKSFIKNAVGILIVVAVCFVAVMIYKKGNDSINDSMKDYDELMIQFDNAKLKNYENAVVSGSQIIDLLKRLEVEDIITVEVLNGYNIKEKKDAQIYSYSTIHGKDSTVFLDIIDKTNKEKYINPSASFESHLVYDDNNEIASVVFKQK